MQGIRFDVVVNRNSMSSSLSCLTEVLCGTIFFDVHFLSIFSRVVPDVDCWICVSHIDVEGSSLFRHKAVAMSLC